MREQQQQQQQKEGEKGKKSGEKGEKKKRGKGWGEKIRGRKGKKGGEGEYNLKSFIPLKETEVNSKSYKMLLCLLLIGNKRLYNKLF